MKKSIWFIFVCLFVCSARPVWAEASSFVVGFEDLPLMAGLSQAEEDPLSFDTPSGRIIESYAQSEQKEQAEILDFYDKTLPQLGWKSLKKEQSKISFIREGEELTVSVDAGAEPSVHFELTTTQKD